MTQSSGGANATTRQHTEITIPMPWGHIAGKAWNDKNGIRVLFVHGIMDNAGSFDDLIPLLPETYYCVAIDLPGHGKSSHLPRGLPLRALDNALTIERVVDFLGWDKFMYVGHSLGGNVGFTFSSIFNDRVSKLVVLDVVLVGMSSKYCIDNIAKAFTELKDMEKRMDFAKAPEYSYEDAITRLLEGRPDVITERSAKTLAKRSLVEHGSGYRFSMDQRLKTYERVSMSEEQMMELLSRIRCPILHILTDEYCRINYLVSLFWPIRSMFEKRLGESYQYHIVEGHHSVHMDHPERVKGLIENFLGSTKCHL